MLGKMHKTTSASALTIASAAAALSFPPQQETGFVPTAWSAAGVVPQLDVKVRSDATTAITAAEIYGGELVDDTVADDAITLVDFANDALDLTTGELQTGSGPFQFTTTGTLPTNMVLVTNYWAVRESSGSIKIATSLENALDGTVVSLSDVGSGTHTLVDVPTTKTVVWYSMGLLGHAQDGVVNLTVVKGYVVRIDNRPDVVGYAVSATPDTGNITITLTPVYAA